MQDDCPPIDLVERFTTGDCWLLAIELHRLTGWPVQAFANAKGEPTWHVWVRTPSGRLLDIEGSATPRAMSAQYTSTTVEEGLALMQDWPADTIYNAFSRNGECRECYTGSRAIAADIAQDIVDVHTIGHEALDTAATPC